MQRRETRRAVLKGASAAGTVFAANRLASERLSDSARAATRLSVLSPIPPDPAPPGVARFAEDLFETWKSDHDVRVTYDAVRWPDLRDEIASELDAEDGGPDVVYMSGWIPDFFESLSPLEGMIPSALTNDLPISSRNGVAWNGSVYGVPYTTSLLTLFYNETLFDSAGLPGPPTTWDELKAYARELTTDDNHFGWVMNYGAPYGVGGVASYWMAFLQQAGGTLFGADGMPNFAADSGVDALQLMIDLLPSTVPESLTMIGIIDATTAFKRGRAAMMFNWPFMWKDAQDPATSDLPGQLGTAVLPSGPVNNASIDGSDAWSISALSGDPEMSLELIQFYLDPEVQKRQATENGWLPARLSVLANEEVQAAFPHAAIVLQQAQSPYSSFLTPDFDAVTEAIGVEIQRALGGEQTAAQALNAASDSVTRLLEERMGH